MSPDTVQQMVALSKDGARSEFAARFKEAAEALPGAPKGRGLVAWLAETIKPEVGREGIRKWLTGDALPNQARMLGLAEFLSVRVQWLRDGELPKRVGEEADPAAEALDNALARRIADQGAMPYIDPTNDPRNDPRALFFASEWMKLRAPLKQMVSNFVETLVAEQKRGEVAAPAIFTPEPKVSITSSKPRHHQAKESSRRPKRTSDH